MKFHKFYLSFCIAYLLLTVPLSAQWNQLTTNPSYLPLVRMASEHNGFSAYNFSNSSQNCLPGINRSFDDWVNFSTVHSYGSPYRCDLIVDLVALNDSVAFFVEDAEGFISVWRTTDRGDTWAQIGNTTPYGEYWAGGFYTEGYGYVATYQPNSMEYIIYQVDTAGTSVISTFGDLGRVERIIQQNDSTLFILGVDSLFNGVIRRTVDEGQNWTEVYNTNTLSLGYFGGLEFLDDTLGYTVGYWGQLLRTTDGGLSWNNFGTSVPAEILSFEFTDPQTGWFASYEGKLYTTNDAGTTWDSTYIGVDEHIEYLHFVSPTVGYLSTENGKLFKLGGTVGVPEPVQPSSGLQLFPNPAQDQVNIMLETPYQERVQLSVYDLSGRRVVMGEMQSVELKAGLDLEVDQWKSGLYLLQLTSPHIQVTQRFLVK